MRIDFQLGEWIVRPRRDCIERGGKVVHVKPKSMAVLERLAQAAGDVVTRSELFDAVWPGSEVTDDVLTQCIVELRRAFKDSAHNSRFIETIPKVGFRLLPAVTSIHAAGEAEEDHPRAIQEHLTSDPWKPANQAVLSIVSIVLMGLVLFWYLTGSREVPEPAVSAEIKSLAVLPFVDISEQHDQEWYAYGLTEELISRLSQLEGLQVTGRTSSYYFQDRNEDLRQIGQALGVNHLLEGSVRTDDNSLRITAQLIEASNGFHAWSGQFDRPREDIFAVQEDIAEAVAAALSIKLQVGDLGTQIGGTESVEAYELLMLSRKYQWEDTPESNQQAINCLKQAIEIDPGYARAWWSLAGMYVNTHSNHSRTDDTDYMLLSQQALDHARKLEPDLPGVKFMTATIQYTNRQWSDVEKTMNGGAGLLLGSEYNLMHGWVGFLMRVGRVNEAIPFLERMRQLNPFALGAAIALGDAYTITGRMEEGFAEAERAFELDGFKFKTVLSGLHLALSTRDLDLIRKWLARAEQYLPEDREMIAAMSETLGDRKAALTWLRDAFQRTTDYDLLIPFWAAWHGDEELALDAMQRLPVPFYFWGNELKEVRRMQRFNDVLRQVNMEEYFREYGWNDFCRPRGSEDFVCQ